MIKKKYPSVKIQRFDISEHSRIEEFIDNVALDLGGLDILINNAGINKDNISIRMKDEEWKKVIDVNLTSTFLLCKHSIKIMLKNKFGRIVNITSIVGHSGNPGQSNYAASKAGIIGMSKCLAIEYAKKNITVNCVSPGFIATDMTMNIAEKVKAIIVDKLGVDESEIAMTSSFTNDLGADSLDTVELIMEFEKTFDISIPDEHAENITTVGEAVEYLSSQVK